MILEKLPDVQRLSIAEKWLLIEELWEQLVPRPESEPNPAMIALLEARMAEYRENPELASSWNDVKARLQAARGI
jgi:putative addiction module component (TIGR02574 family)